MALGWCLQHINEVAMPEHNPPRTMSIRVHQAFADETETLAKAPPEQVSAYILEAVREKNERELARRIRVLSKRQSARNLAENKSMEGALTDRIA